ncbi:MAG: hydroxyacid dehydrogenase, partial [Nitrospinota bacterium]
MTKKFKVLVADKLDSSSVEILTFENDIEADVKVGLSPSELVKIIPEYDALIVRSATKATKEIIEAGSSLKVIGRAGIGVDNIDVDAASAKGIVVMNTPGGNTVTTAEHTIAMLMSLARKIPQATSSVKNGKWEKSLFVGVELSEKTLGMIGMGRIGMIVANRALGLNMRVKVYDPYLTDEAAEKQKVELVTLDQIYSEADVITIHTPLTDETKGMINDIAFQKMKDGVMIINCARGGIVDELALVNHIKSKKVLGAALDVFENEPLSSD